MQFIADLHIHSYLSRATSKQLNLPNLNKWAQLKGLQLIGTGDFTHPKWLGELKEMLVPAEEGLFRLKDEYKGQPEQEVYPSCKADVRFMLSVEISSIYKRNGQVRKVHNVVFMPHLAAAEKFQTALERIGNIRSDGRPILGLDSRDLLEIVLETDPQGYLIPAHIWTPWFSVLGSKSGFDTIDECYDDLIDHIFAVETGLSSDPPMNWQLSQLDRFALVSNSDAHSPPNLAREANLFDTDLSYPALFEALKTKDPNKFLGTIEFHAEEGKYHLDGHRKCNVRLNPAETQLNNGLCPVCGKKVTIGVLNRVFALADRKPGYRPSTAAPFRSLVPLAEIIAEVQGFGPKSKNVQEIFHKMLSKYGSELKIIEKIPLKEIEKFGHSLLVEAIRRVRAGELHVEAGYDGEYGTVKLFQPEERERFLAQLVFLPQSIPSPKKKAKKTAPANRIKDEPAINYKPIPTKKQKAEPASPPTPVDSYALLNDSQQQAMKHTNGPVLIIAGPGTGKTRTLTYRISHLVQQKNIAPDSILAITFTRHAAREMLERLKTLLGETLIQQMTICTFHALGNLILQREIEVLGKKPEFTIFTENDRLEVLRSLKLNLSEKHLRQLAENISGAKNKLIPAVREKQQQDFLFENEFWSVYAKYETALQRLNAIDYDDLILLPCLLFKQFPDVRKAYRKKFQWISVDEYQDINYAQFQFLRLLLDSRQNLCAIGDPNQAIYSFRGADIRYFNKFSSDFKNAKIIRLGQNYRSTSQILDASTQVITVNPQMHSSELWSEIHSQTQVEIVEVATEKAEAEYVVHQIEQQVGGTGFFSLDSNRVSGNDEDDAQQTFSDFAVLYRLRAQCSALEEAFLRSGMPYQTMGDTPFFEKKPIKILLSYLKILHNPHANLDFLRILNTPPRGLGEKAISALVDYCEKNQFSIYEGIENQALITRLNLSAHQAMQKFFKQIRELQFEAEKNTVFMLLQILLDDFGLRKHLGESKENERLWEILLNYAKSYDCRLEKFVNDILLLNETDSFDPRAERITLMSLHASKGLEFPVVFIVGCEDDLLPYRQRGGQSVENLEAALQEERRLLYVGMTRAQKRLFLLHSRNRFLFGKREKCSPSPFLSDIETALKRSRESFGGKKKIKKSDSQLELF